MAATLSDVARQVGLARSTVADILRGRPGYSQETCRRTREAARRLGFVPNYFARSLQQQRSNTIGVAGRLGASGVTGATLKAIAEGLLARGYMPLFCESSDRTDGVRRAVEELQRRLVDGIILSADYDDAVLGKVLPENLPCIMIRSAEGPGCSCVICERFEAFVQGVQWLAERGHRRIAFMGVDNAGSMHHRRNTHRLKIEGYRAGMGRLGLSDDGLLLDCGPMPGETREFVQGHGDLFKTITAILACNDRIAIEVMTGLAELGVRVPEDCSVIGFDDTEFAVAVRPRLTSFRPQHRRAGTKAVEMLLGLIEGRDVESVMLVPELIERESAGFCREV